VWRPKQEKGTMTKKRKPLPPQGKWNPTFIGDLDEVVRAKEVTLQHLRDKKVEIIVIETDPHEVKLPKMPTRGVRFLRAIVRYAVAGLVGVLRALPFLVLYIIMKYNGASLETIVIAFLIVISADTFWRT
jgi:hypothetical protein